MRFRAANIITQTHKIHSSVDYSKDRDKVARARIFEKKLEINTFSTDHRNIPKNQILRLSTDGLRKINFDFSFFACFFYFLLKNENLVKFL